MLILAFDTTSDLGGVGIFRDLECLAQVANDDPANRYSITLFSMVDKAIEQAQARYGVPAGGLAEIELIAVASGPGSFTGIRIGLAAAQGWAKAFDLPVRGVSVLDALVEAAQIRTEWAVPILDARRGEFYVELVERAPATASAPRQPALEVPLVGAPARPPLQPDQGWLLKPTELGAILPSRLPEGAAVTCVAREHDRAARALREHLSGAFQWQTVAGTLVESIARLGLRLYGTPQAAARLDACYIRRPDAQVPNAPDTRKPKFEIRNSKMENGN